MLLTRRLYETALPLARATTVAALTVGLGYTVVTTGDGGLGLSFTWLEDREKRSYANHYHDVEGEPADVLLERLLSDDPFQRSIGLATVNALNRERAMGFDDDGGMPLSRSLRALAIGPGTHVCMVGYFPPLAGTLPGLGAELEVIDSSLGLGDPLRFRELLGTWADALVVTATAILNDSIEDLLAAAAPRVRTLVLGPSTPLVPEAFSHLRVDVLAGIVPLDPVMIERVVRHGAATPGMKPYVRKVYCRCSRPGEAERPHAVAARRPGARGAEP
jgi:hypothetical protein